MVTEIRDFSSISKKNIALVRENLSLVKAGMFWYLDNSFSFDLKPQNKLENRVKAIVELVDDGVIYGDLMLSSVKEQELTWNQAKQYIEEFSCHCRENERIILYNIRQLDLVCKGYAKVQKTFDRYYHCDFIKSNRNPWNDYWSFSECGSKNAFIGSIKFRVRKDDKSHQNYVRPVLALRIKDSENSLDMIEEKVTKVIADFLEDIGNEKFDITLNTDLRKEFNFDYGYFRELSEVLEENFPIYVYGSYFATWQTVGDIVNTVRGSIE